ncbi:glycerol-3-phosphate dehydrogenase [Loa loa]|uniref:Glycerol-3-phosphate dehydrogenase [NAD(+)] n=1 Tax=Loa loa TaxID=7209 RepID=A0A1I7VFF2_LOALO|nr:glycerol-3-phosphate dehydrogenase [Loa loa]EFO27767.1 glycerol-3-phosphate dehydrogenase [Loa loa]
MKYKAPAKITLIGSGHWGSAIALIVGRNAEKYRNDFDPEVRMWVHEEMVNGKKLTEIINTQHENVKYLPGKELSSNVVAVDDLVAACTNSDILIFVIPHQFVESICNQLKGHLKEGALAISLIKGFLIDKKEGVIRLVSEEIRELLNIDTAVLMGANVAQEVANEEFSEATIGYKGQKEKWPILKKLFESDNFRVNLTKDSNTVELCGGLKNIVACATGFADGLGCGNNTKAAIIRLGLLEIIVFVELFYHGSNIQTYFESCGIADLVAACSSGRNRKICEAFVKTRKSIQDLEREVLNGQSVQGPATAEAVFVMLKKHNMVSRFPLFVAVHQICNQQLSPSCLMEHLRECKSELPDNWVKGQQFFTNAYQCK